MKQIMNTSRRNHLLPVISVLFLLCFNIFSSQSLASTQEPVPTIIVQKQALELRQDIENLFMSEGTGALQRYWRQHADEGVNLQALREIVLAETGGQPQLIPVRVHPRGVSSVDFANSQMQLSGIDFYRFEAVPDTTLPEPQEPSADERKTYNRWRVARSIVVPLIGFAGTIAEASMSAPALVGGVPHSSLSILPSVARGFAVLGLELQFSLFSNRWAKVWEQKQPLISGEIPLLPASEQSYFRQKINGVVKHLNRALEATRFVTRAHVYNYLVNWGYTLVLYTAGFVTQNALGLPGESFSVVRLIADTWLLNTAFYFAFGLSQISLGNLTARREISALQRYQIETIAVKWNSLWRMISLVPGLKPIGIGMQLFFGGVITTPLLLRLAGTDAYSRETARRFNRNEGVAPPQASLCERTLSKASGLLQFNRKASIWNVLKSVKDSVLKAIGFGGH